MATLDDLVRDLIDRYDGDDRHPGDGGPGLLRRLDDVAERTSQPKQTAGRTAPGSRPPTPLEAVSWSQRFKREAIDLDRDLRRSNYPQTWEKAMRAIPPNAEASDRVREATRTVGIWHGTVQTVLGLRGPSTHFKYVLCLACGKPTVYGRADDDRPRAWCTNDACEDGDTGRPARYEGARIDLLTINRAS